MSNPWLWGTIGAIAFFVFWERYAFRHPDRVNTLSRTIYNIGKAFPLSIFIMGMFAGGLAVHFFWHWCPDGGTGVGFLGIPHERLINPATDCFTSYTTDPPSLVCN